MNYSSDGGGSHAANSSIDNYCNNNAPAAETEQPPKLSRYESQKKRDWTTFGQYLKNHRPPVALSKCSGAHVLEFLKYLDQFGKTRVHEPGACPYYGHPQPPAACECPLRQAWGSLDALVGRLRAAFDENGAGSPESNPFGSRAVRLYLRHVRDSQSKARGIAYEKKRRKKFAGSHDDPVVTDVTRTTQLPDIHVSAPRPVHVSTAINHCITRPGAQLIAPNPDHQLLPCHVSRSPVPDHQLVAPNPTGHVTLPPQLLPCHVSRPPGGPDHLEYTNSSTSPIHNYISI